MLRLYNAARLAGCFSGAPKTLIFANTGAHSQQPARAGLKGDLNREQKKTSQP